MVSLSTWCRYLVHKASFSISYSVKNCRVGRIPQNEVLDTVWKNLFEGRLTYLHWNKGQEMAPMIAGEGGLLVRKLPDATPMTVFVGDVVVLKDPEKPEDYLVRRLTAIEGYEMVSTDEKDEPFVLEKDQCWVVSDNETFKPKEARDSRTFGPLTLGDIVGRVLYTLRTPVDHGPVQNSHEGMQQDLPVLAVELDGTFGYILEFSFCHFPEVGTKFLALWGFPSIFIGQSTSSEKCKGRIVLIFPNRRVKCHYWWFGKGYQEHLLYEISAYNYIIINGYQQKWFFHNF